MPLKSGPCDSCERFFQIKLLSFLFYRFTSTRDGFMRISEAEVEDSGEYICTATNRVGSQSASVVITVEGVFKKL